LYPNLEAEMKRNGINNDDIAKALDKSPRAIQDKRSGRTQFTLQEARMIKTKLFPNIDFDYLFKLEQ